MSTSTLIGRASLLSGLPGRAGPCQRPWEARGTTAPELQIDIVRSPAALAQLVPDWNALIETAGTAHHVFQTPGLAQVWADVYGRDTAYPKLAIVTARRNGRLVLVLPLVETRQLGLRVLSWLGEPIAQYGDALVDTGEPASALLEAAFARLATELSPDVLRLRKVRRDAAIVPYLAATGITGTNEVEAPLVTLAAAGSPFDCRQSAKARKNRRRLARRLEERGAVVHLAAAGDETASSIAASGLSLKRDWLVRHALISSAFADRRLDRFMHLAAGEAAAATGCRVFALTLADRTVAAAIGFVLKQRLMLHVIAHSPDVEKCGAGVLTLEAILRWAEAQGLDAVDLLPPKAEYKLDWADVTMPVADHVWGCTTAGRAMVGLVDTVVMPRAKRAVERLPLALRKPLMRRALRTAVADRS